MSPLVYESVGETATAALGAALAEVLPDGTTVALLGTLGAGKTRLVQAIAEASGVDRRAVLSPTFVLAREYHGRRPIYHLDAYRIADEDEFEQLGPDEYFDGDGLTLVEWADRVDVCLPRERIEIRVEVTGEQTRRFTIAAKGDALGSVVEQLAKRIP